MTATLDDEVAELRRDNAELRRTLDERTGERDEALAQKAAMAEVMGVINSSPGDLAPVFDAILEKATRLCDAPSGIFWTFDGEFSQAAALYGIPDRYADYLGQPVPLDPATGLGRVRQGERVAVSFDLAAEEPYRTGNPQRRAFVDLGRARSAVRVPLVKGSRLLGICTVYRQEVRPFSDAQIALLQNFAAQAVIAMESARLLTETREALEQQTATAEVLQVINSSPGDLTPVFDAMLEKAVGLCDAAYGVLRTFDGEFFHLVAMRGEPNAVVHLKQLGAVDLGSVRADDMLGRIVRGEAVVHIADVRKTHTYRDNPVARERAEAANQRTWLAVALRKDAALLGVIMTYRAVVRPFSDKQIALLQNFAAQAVIAMENARLLTETREALEQQTATAEVLQVINSSPGELTPVFDAMLEKATRLSEAAFGIMQVYDGERFRTVATRNMPPALAEFLLRTPRQPTPHSAVRRILDGEDFVQFEDMTSEPAYLSGDPRQHAFVELGGTRTYVAVALRKDDRLLGTIATYRREIRPFSDKQIALLQNFAAQAVIAMENARLITETREALDQQTATAEVLQVINSSPGDLVPVFGATLEKAVDLCGASFGLLMKYDGEALHTVAHYNSPPKFVEFLRTPVRPAPGMASYRILRGEDVVTFTDVAADPSYVAKSEAARMFVELSGARSHLTVALRKEGVFLGQIVLYRQEVLPFTKKQIALVQNFAAQAVIAMENARLITETQEALEQQTATAEVLGVINASPGDLAPVFEAMLDKATRLCEAVHGHLATFDGKFFRFVAVHGEARMVEEQQARGLLPPSFGVTWPRLLHGDSVVHVTDVMDTDLYRTGHQGARWFVDIGGGRTVLTIALRKEDALLGALTVYRREVRPFTDKQIALAQNFAAQAVIAMENARLITETREALEQQTATAEVLQVINSSPGDLAPVFDAMLEKAIRLCEADEGLLTNRNGDEFEVMAARSSRPEMVAASVDNRFAIDRGTVAGRVMLEGCTVHIRDVNADPDYRNPQMAKVQPGTLLGVPLLREGVAVGSFSLARERIEAFTEKQIAVVENFAAQAVIAMENARLLDEIRQRQAELRVTFDNMVDGVAMFDGELRLTAWNLNFQRIAEVPAALLAERPSYTEYLRILMERGELDAFTNDAEFSRRLENTDQELRLERTRPNGRVIEVRRNAVPDGGFVLIYSDITERKRSESEIRAARDAAEAAYRDLKAAQASLIQAEKMASLGQLTAGIAHEIKNPLNFVNNFAGLSVELLDELKATASPAITALDDEKRAEIDETIEMLTGNLEKIAEHGRRADNIVKSMLEHSRGSSGDRRNVDLNGLIEEALNLAYHGGRAQDQSFSITLERDYAAGVAPIEIVPQDITRVCLNLFSNGFYAATKRQREVGDPNFKPTLKVTTRDLGDAVEIRIRDNGIGIPTGIKDKLFQPFFTTKPTGEGTGLGLSISYDIVTQQHGGTITVDSRIGEFTEFTVRLPRTHHTTMAEAAS